MSRRGVNRRAVLSASAGGASALLLALLPVLATSAEAGLTAPAIQSVDASPPAGARVPLSVALRDETGVPQTLQAAIGHTPSVLILADYACHALCGPVLTLVGTSLARSGLSAGRDYRLVVVGLDPGRGFRAAKDMKTAQIGEDGELAAATSFLTPDQAALQAITSALGYRSVYDREADQFAHPAVAFVLTADGRVARMLSALGIGAGDLRLALVEAGEGRIGSALDQMRLLCYGFDPAAGVYTPSIHALLALGWLLTALALGGAIAMMGLARNRASAP
jgi:protein SCO1/2